LDPQPQANPNLNPSSDRTDARSATPAGAKFSALESYFKTGEVVEILDCSRRQLQYWAKTGLIQPSARTPGGHHRYRFADLVALKATTRLINAGVSVQKIRRSVRALQTLLTRLEHPLGQLVLVATGDVVLAFRDDTVFEAISGEEWVFAVADFEQEVAAYRSTAHSENRESLPVKPGPRGTRRLEKDWRQTG
jgi:DNA-binding transcriptional MerR regulator